MTSEPIEGLRFVGASLTAELCIAQFMPDIERMCEHYRIPLHDVIEIQVVDYTFRFRVLHRDVHGNAYADETGEVACVWLEHEIEPHLLPAWWMPYSGVVVDHALAPVAQGQRHG